MKKLCAVRQGARRQRGFSVVLMLAVIVLMGGMVAYSVTLASTTGSGVAQDVGVARAAQAAQAGLEWGRYRVQTGVLPSCVAITTLNIPLTSGPMPVTVRCLLTGTHLEGGQPVNTYQLSATACAPAPAGCPNGAGAPNYVERTVSGIAQR